jgi:hypothetical protein
MALSLQFRGKGAGALPLHLLPLPFGHLCRAHQSGISFRPFEFFYAPHSLKKYYCALSTYRFFLQNVTFSLFTFIKSAEHFHLKIKLRPFFVKMFCSINDMITSSIIQVGQNNYFLALCKL